MQTSLDVYYGDTWAPSPYENSSVATYASNIVGRADWLPDASVQLFVENILHDLFTGRIDVQATFFTKPEWIPITILSTLEWIKIGGWWIFQYSKVGLTNEAYDSVWSYIDSGIVQETDPSKLVVIRKDPNRSYFRKRCDEAGLTDQEFSDLLPFIKKVGFPTWNKEAPPEDILEVIIWCTLLWVLSDDAEEWCQEMDIIFDYASRDPREGGGWAFLSSELDDEQDGMRLLDPRKMKRENRPVGSCSRCGTKQWCVDGYIIMGNTTMQKSQQTNPEMTQNWVHLCNFCAIDLNQFSEYQVADDNVSNPQCGNKMCVNTNCPNLKTAKDKFGNVLPQVLLDMGRNRINQYEKFIEQNGGTPRQLAGQTLDQIMDHFRPTGWK